MVLKKGCNQEQPQIGSRPVEKVEQMDSRTQEQPQVWWIPVQEGRQSGEMEYVTNRSRENAYK